MSDLNNVFARVNALRTGDFKGAFRTEQTVSIEKHPEHPERYVLRFGAGKDDYFSVGEKVDAMGREALREILSKVIESPTQLKKIKGLPLEKRPELGMESGMGRTGGYCNGNHIVVSSSMGTGYKAASIFVHEFQHQYQYTHDGIDHYKGNLSLAEDILDDRLYESAAETAAYQYLYEMKDANPQAWDVYRKAKSSSTWYAQGMRDYAAAKEAGKSEDECVLAGMRGYASNYYLADSYEFNYHRDMWKDPSQELRLYAGYLHQGLKDRAVGKMDKDLSGDRLNEVAAFKSHTVGMAEMNLSEDQIRETVRSPEYGYVTTNTAKALKHSADRYRELTGKKHPKTDEVFSVRDVGGVRQSTEAEKKNAKFSLRETLRKAQARINGALSDLLRGPARPVRSSSVLFKPKTFVCDIYDGENILLSLDGKKKDLKDFTGALYYKPDLSYKRFADVPGGDKELFGREDKLNDVLSVIMKDENLRAGLTGHGSENPLTVGFSENPDIWTDTPAIVLDPRKPAKELVEDFKKQYTERKQKDRTAGQTGKTAKQDGKQVKPKEAETAFRAPDLKTKAITGRKNGFFNEVKSIYQKRENTAKAVRAARLPASRREGR